MKGKQRIMTALQLGQPDTVPVWEQAFNEASIVGIAKNFVEADNLPEPKSAVDMSPEEISQLFSALLAFVRELDLDGVTATSVPPNERLDEKYCCVGMAKDRITCCQKERVDWRSDGQWEEVTK